MSLQRDRKISSTTARAARFRNRALTLVFATTLSVLLMCGAGFDPFDWWRQHQASLAASRPVPAPSGRISVVDPTPLGTDSSVSAVPRALHLVATRLGRNPSEGDADIGVDPRSPQTYRARAILANGARIEEIYADHVVLKRDGRATNLYVDSSSHRHDETGLPSDASESLATVGGTKSPPLATANTQDEFSATIRVSPEYDGDTLKGLRVYAGPNAAAFHSLGLEPGDQIISIDSASVTNSKAAIESLQRLTQGVAISVVVRRGDQIVPLALDGSNLRSQKRT